MAATARVVTPGVFIPHPQSRESLASRHLAISASPEAGTEARPGVVLAGVSSETSAERAFLDGSAVGDRVIAEAVAQGRPAGPLVVTADVSDRSHPDRMLEDAFDRALRAGDARTSAQIAALIESRLGTRAVYDAMSRCLAQLGSAWEDGRGTILAERVAFEACLSVCERLWARCPEPVSTGLVVLATPPGERHTLALRAIGHQLQKAGRRVQVVEDLPETDLCEAVTGEGTSALVLSMHLPLSLAAVRRLLGPVRAAAPQLFVVLGGPGVPQGAGAVADLVTEDPEAIVLALAGHESCLTVREREVLAAVADGLTTQEIAARLCLSSSTVKTHLDHILTKTGTEHRAAAVARAMREGWLR